MGISPVNVGRDSKNCAEDGFFKLILDVLHSMANDTGTLRNESDERWWSRWMKRGKR